MLVLATLELVDTSAPHYETGPNAAFEFRIDSQTVTDRGTHCAGLTEASTLNMVPVPTNKIDSHAVALYHNGKHLGYIP